MKWSTYSVTICKKPRGTQIAMVSGSENPIVQIIQRKNGNIKWREKAFQAALLHDKKKEQSAS